MRADLAEGILFTDQYQLAMAQLYFAEGIHDRRAHFDYSFRSYPDYGRHQAGYCVYAGLEWLLGWMETARFGGAELAALRSQTTSRGAPRFRTDFLEWLEAEGHFGAVELHSVAEGRVVHPLVPLVTATGPLAMTQILETSLLNHLNYQTLIATKASRVAEAARGSVVLEFGMRRGAATGVNAGARAALIGGARFTSNTGISHVLGVDPKGTHAHSMVQAFIARGGTELEAFRAFARVYPDECVLLVDTVDTLESGVPNAITVFEELARAGHEPLGIRLDSGDLAYLAIQAARRLDAAGFTDTQIVLSNSLDELNIWQILSQIEEEADRYGVDASRLAARLVYGVGTRLITSHGRGALDGVYKLVAVEDDAGLVVPTMKLSDTPGKQPIPGSKELWRIYDARGNATADAVAMAGEQLEGIELRLHHPHRAGLSRTLSPGEVSEVERLRDVVWAGGGRAEASVSLDLIRARRVADLTRLDPGVRRIIGPHIYHVSITEEVRRVRDDLRAGIAGG